MFHKNVSVKSFESFNVIIKRPKLSQQLALVQIKKSQILRVVSSNVPNFVSLYYCAI